MRTRTSLGLLAAAALAFLGACSSSSKKNDAGSGGTGGTAMGGSGGSGGGGGMSAGGSGGARDAGAAGSGGAAGMGAGGADAGARDVAAGGSGGSGGSPGDGGGMPGDVGPAKLTVNMASIGGSMAKGTATFEKVGNNIKLTVDLTGVMPAGKHGIHIHQNASCADTMDDAGVTAGGAAGAHWNPTNAMHGTSVDTGHLGDIGNIDAMADGKAMLNLVTDKWSLGTGMTNDVTNHAIILHAMMDDGTTQPTGNSGGRIACAVIK